MNQVVVFNCPRSALAPSIISEDPKMQEDLRVQVVPVPCIGRISLALLSQLLVDGASGILILGRHEPSCRYHGAETPAINRIKQMQNLLRLSGQDERRVQFRQPASGAEGPQQCVKNFVSQIKTLLAQEATVPPKVLSLASRTASIMRDKTQVPVDSSFPENLDLIERGFYFLANQPRAKLEIRHKFLDELQLPSVSDNSKPQPIILGDQFCFFSMLDKSWLRPLDAQLVLHQTIKALALLGITNLSMQPAVMFKPLEEIPLTPAPLFSFCGVEHERARKLKFDCQIIDEIIDEKARALSLPRRPEKIVFFKNDNLSPLLKTLGFSALEIEEDPLPDAYVFSPAQRKQADDVLKRAQAQGAEALLVKNPRAWVRWSLITRHGTWRESLLTPVIGSQLGYAALTGCSLDDLTKEQS